MARLKKIIKQFRMNVEFVALLEALAKKHGTTQTDVIEWAIADLAKKEFNVEQKDLIVTKKVMEELKNNF